MGLYCTTTSLEVLLIGQSFDSLTTSLVNKLITHSENEINKWISKRYDIATFNTTSTSVPPMLTSLAETLTEGYFYQRNSRGGKEGLAQGKVLIDQALANLKDISEYKLDLLNSAGAVIQDMSQTAYRLLSTTDQYVETFAEDSSLDWKVDQNKLDDIKDDRD